eukprot:1653767-Amphidinium_carterae.1
MSGLHHCWQGKATNGAALTCRGGREDERSCQPILCQDGDLRTHGRTNECAMYSGQCLMRVVWPTAEAEFVALAPLSPAFQPYRSIMLTRVERNRSCTVRGDNSSLGNR